MGGNAGGLEFKMPVPCECHEYVGRYKKANCENCWIHVFICDWIFLCKISVSLRIKMYFCENFVTSLRGWYAAVFYGFYNIFLTDAESAFDVLI